MIDNKPFRVTNEQAKALAIGGESTRTLIRSVDNITEFMQDISSDLLDARELIDKQEAIIKKQSILLQAVEKDLNWMLNEGKLLAPHAFKYFYDGIKELEKTKDYA